MHGGGALAIDRWHAAAEESAPDGRVFIQCPVRKNGAVVGDAGMSPNALMNRLAIRAKEARIETCSPHDLRRTFVSTALTNGADLAMVQALAGHASPATTARYDRRGDDAKRVAASMVAVPCV